MFRTAFFAIAALVVLTAGQPRKASAQSIEEIQAFAADVLRRQLPVRIDQLTTLYDASSDGDTLVYAYGLQANKRDIDIDLFQSKMGESLNSNVCSNGSMVEVMNMGGRYKYVYTGNDGAFIGSFIFSSDDC